MHRSNDFSDAASACAGLRFHFEMSGRLVAPQRERNGEKNALSAMIFSESHKNVLVH